MKAALFLALKDVLKDKKILLMIVLVIGIGVTASLTVSGLFNGFQSYFTDVTVNVMTGHLTVFPREDRAYITNLKNIERKIELLPEVAGAAPRLTANAIAVKGSKESQVLVTGLTPSKEKKTTKMAGKVVAGEFLSDSDNGILVGSRLAEKLNAKIGEKVSLTFRNGVVNEYKIKGFLDIGSRTGDEVAVYLTNRRLGEVLGVEDSASQIFVKLADISLVDKSKTGIMQLGIDGEVKTWKEMSAFVENISRNFNFIFGIINFLSLAASAVSVAVVMFINVEHKTREIGILKAVGARNSFVMRVFMTEILLYATFGVIVGNALGYAFTSYLQASPMVTFGERGEVAIIPIMSFSDSLRSTLTVFAITILAGLYPVIIATRMDTIRAIWGGGG